MNDVQEKYREILANLENTSIRPSQVFRELHDYGLNAREIQELVLEHTILWSSDGISKILWYYSQAEEYGYTDEKLDHLTMKALSRRREQHHRVANRVRQYLVNFQVKGITFDVLESKIRRKENFWQVTLIISHVTEPTWPDNEKLTMMRKELLEKEGIHIHIYTTP
jgi:hypothetical protein